MTGGEVVYFLSLPHASWCPASVSVMILESWDLYVLRVSTRCLQQWVLSQCMQNEYMGRWIDDKYWVIGIFAWLASYVLEYYY